MAPEYRNASRLYNEQADRPRRRHYGRKPGRPAYKTWVDYDLSADEERVLDILEEFGY